MADVNIVLNVRGMSCEHCVRAVKNALEGLSGVKGVDISLGSGKVSVDYDDAQTSLEEIKSAIADEGYETE